ncbi:hypothetical protein LZ554_003559 [Drepanopeziza brunnea f. sp. 'monogermtubi']|nr:hypothetical protein LZ554_003559 [Drepanopeziza brunnea f. sp. 'monogermtubi']
MSLAQVKDLAFNIHGWAMHDGNEDSDKDIVINALNISMYPFDRETSGLSPLRIYRSSSSFTEAELSPPTKGINQVLLVGYMLRSTQETHLYQNKHYWYGRQRKSSGTSRPNNVIAWDGTAPPIPVVTPLWDGSLDYKPRFFALLTPESGLCTPYFIKNRGMVFFRSKYRSYRGSAQRRETSWGNNVRIAMKKILGSPQDVYKKEFKQEDGDEEDRDGEDEEDGDEKGGDEEDEEQEDGEDDDRESDNDDDGDYIKTEEEESPQAKTTARAAAESSRASKYGGILKQLEELSQQDSKQERAKLATAKKAFDDSKLAFEREKQALEQSTLAKEGILAKRELATIALEQQSKTREEKVRSQELVAMGREQKTKDREEKVQRQELDLQKIHAKVWKDEMMVKIREEKVKENEEGMRKKETALDEKLAELANTVCGLRQGLKRPVEDGTELDVRAKRQRD